MTGWTVQDLLADRMTLTATCRNNHHTVLDLTVLCERLGPDAPAMASDLLPQLVCRKCGEKETSITYAPNTRPTGL